MTLVSLGLAAQGLSSSSIPSVEGKVLSQAPVIDGVIDSAEWREAATVTASFEDNETGAVYNKPVTFWVGTTAKGIYFAAKVQDDPRSLSSDEYRQNVGLEANDYIQLSVEPFAKGSGFNQFRINPSGANQIIVAGGRAAKTEWLGALQTAAKVLEDGWQGEMFVPWALMELPSPGTRTIMVNVTWNEMTSQRRYMWKYNAGDGTKTPTMTGVEIPRVDTGRTLQLLPFAYAGYDDEGKRAIVNAGLDFKTSLTQRSQLVGTISPDFRNIENQVLSLDFSYFERLAGESRPFFLEGQGFRGNQGMGDRLFASQRIRAFDAGINTYGSLDDRSNYSLLSTVDFGGRTAVAANYSRQISNKDNMSAAYVGNFQDGLENHAARVAYGRRMGAWFLDGSGSFTRDQAAGEGRRLGVGINHNGPGTFFFLGYNEVSPDYLPRLGFAPQRDFRSMSAYYSFEKPHPRGSLLETEIGGGVDYGERWGSSEVYSRGGNVNASFTFRDGPDVDLGASQSWFLGFVDTLYSISIEKPRRNQYRRWSLDYTTGNLAGRAYEQVGLSLRYRPLKRVQLFGSVQWQDHFEKSRQAILSLNYDKGLFESIGGRLVERDGDINWYLSYRRSGGLGNEFFLILGDPNSRSFRKQLILKAVFPLSVKY